jgi:hypothetical protein
LELAGSGWGLVVSSFEHIDESLGSTNDGEFHDQLSDCQLLKNNFSVKLLMQFILFRLEAGKVNLEYKKFWEELFTYFLLYDMEYIGNNASNGSLLPQECIYQAIAKQR